MIVTLRVAGATQQLFGGLIESLADHNAAIFRAAREAGPVTPPHQRPIAKYRPVKASGVVELADVDELDRNPIGSCGEWSASMLGWLRALGKRSRLIVERTGGGVWHATVQIGPQSWDPMRELPWTS